MCALIDLLNPRIAILFLHTHYANGVKYLQDYLEFQDTYGHNSNGCTYVFDAQLFNGAVDDVSGSHVIPETDMATGQTGSNTISEHRTARNEISTAIPMFLRSSCSVMTMLPEVALYRQYIWRPPKLEVTIYQHIGQLETKFQRIYIHIFDVARFNETGCRRWNFVSICPVCSDVLLPVLAAAISISGITRLPVTSSTTPLNSWTSKTRV